MKIYAQAGVTFVVSLHINKLGWNQRVAKMMLTRQYEIVLASFQQMDVNPEKEDV